MAERRKRCHNCKDLKPPNPDHPAFCADCVPLVQAKNDADYQRYLERRKAKILGRTPQQHLELAREPLTWRHHDNEFERNGVYNCSVTVDADTLAWLIKQAEALHMPNGQTVGAFEMDMAAIEQGLIASWKEDHNN